MKEIRGKRALVTGAASGIGRAIALALAREGAPLWLVDINRERLEQTAAEARALGVAVIITVCDLAQREEISALTGDLLQRWGGVEIVVNNAGMAYYGATENMTAGQWKRILGVNLLAPIQIIHELLPTMLTQTEGHIVNVASIAGHISTRRLAAYHTTKYALVGLSESLRAEHGPHGLGVTALCPGLVETDFFKSLSNGLLKKATPVPPAWTCIKPEKVAHAAIRAIKKNQGMVMVGWMAHLLWRLKRFVPWMVDGFEQYRRKKRKVGEPMVPWVREVMEEVQRGAKE